MVEGRRRKTRNRKIVEERGAPKKDGGRRWLNATVSSNRVSTFPLGRKVVVTGTTKLAVAKGTFAPR